MPYEKGGNSSKENKVLFDPTAHLCIMPSVSVTPQSSCWQPAKLVCGFLFICCHIHASAFLLWPHADLTLPLQLTVPLTAHMVAHFAQIGFRFDSILKLKFYSKIPAAVVARISP